MAQRSAQLSPTAQLCCPTLSSLFSMLCQLSTHVLALAGSVLSGLFMLVVIACIAFSPTLAKVPTESRNRKFEVEY